MVVDRKNTKRVVIYINDSQKNNLQTFLHSLGFHYLKIHRYMVKLTYVP